MAIFPLNVFCYDCSLRSSAVTASVFNALFAAALIIGSLICFGIGGQMSMDQMRSYSYNDGQYYSRGGSDSGLSIMMGIGFALLFLGLVALTVLCFLVQAIARMKATYFIPWLVGDMIYIVLQCLSMLGTFIVACVFQMVAFLPLICFQAAYMAFEIHVWMAVYSYYKKVEFDTSNYKVDVTPLVGV